MGSLTCRVGLLPLGVGELLPLVLGPDPLLPQESEERGHMLGDAWPELPR